MLRKASRRISCKCFNEISIRSSTSASDICVEKIGGANRIGDISFTEMEKAQRITAQKSVLIEAVDNVKFSLIASHLAQTSGAALQTAFKCPLAPPQRVTMKCLQKFLATQQIMTLQTFYLVEMADKNAADLLLHNSSQRGNTFVPSSSRNFQFDSETKSSDIAQFNSIVPQTVPRLTESQLNSALFNVADTDEQFNVLVKEMRISNYSERIRFFIASVIEDSVRSLFPRNVCHPFGSTVNGFGHERSDLDIEWELNTEFNKNGSNGPFLFGGNKPFDIKKTLEVTADWLKLFVPYCNRVIRILNARVPIIKFDHYPTGISCDITTGCNRSGVLMSKILWTYAELDSRVRPLVYSVRRWAEAADITSDKSPGPWLTNFQIIVLVLYFLMAKPQPVLPALDKILTGSVKTDLSHVDTLRPSLIVKPSNTQDTLFLLSEFFDFYAKFDFGKRGMSLTTGKSYPKPDYHPMFFVNPLEGSHNMVKNVNLDQLDRFVRCCSRTCQVLTESSRTKDKKAWGVLPIFNRDHYTEARLMQVSARGQRGKNFDIKSLFEEVPRQDSLKRRHVSFSSD